jgi:hypothetical protein
MVARGRDRHEQRFDLAAVGSVILYLPLYAFYAGTRIFAASPLDVALQAIVQGFLTAIVALLLYGRTVA